VKIGSSAWHVELRRAGAASVKPTLQLVPSIVDQPPRRYESCCFAAVHESPLGTNSPFAALHEFGSYRGFTCRAFIVARPVSFNPQRSSLLTT
jgi:hypothetical protein